MLYTFLLICRFTVFFDNFASVSKFSPWQCLALRLISIEEKANIRYLRWLTSKRNQNIFSLKSKLNQVSFIALPDWQLLCQVSEIKDKDSSIFNDVCDKLPRVLLVINKQDYSVLRNLLPIHLQQDYSGVHYWSISK